MRKPVVMAINGFALGGGCELAMAGDILIASENAKFGQPEVNLGLIPGYGGSQRTTRLIGKGMAAYLCLTGEIIDAKEALRIGLVQRVVPAAELMNEAAAASVIARSALAIAACKRAINNGAHLSIDDGLELEALEFDRSSTPKISKKAPVPSEKAQTRLEGPLTPVILSEGRKARHPEPSDGRVSKDRIGACVTLSCRRVTRRQRKTYNSSPRYSLRAHRGVQTVPFRSNIAGGVDDDHRRKPGHVEERARRRLRVERDIGETVAARANADATPRDSATSTGTTTARGGCEPTILPAATQPCTARTQSHKSRGIQRCPR
jgi:hypothetical protein